MLHSFRTAVSASSLKKAVTESNALAMDAGISLLNAILGNPTMVECLHGAFLPLLPMLCEKGLSSNKGSTSAAAGDACVAIARIEGAQHVVPHLVAAARNAKKKRGQPAAWRTLCALAQGGTAARGAPGVQEHTEKLLANLPTAVQSTDKLLAAAALEAALALLAALPGPTQAALGKFASALPPALQAAMQAPTPAAAVPDSSTPVAAAASGGGSAGGATAARSGHCVQGVELGQPDAEQWEGAAPAPVLGKLGKLLASDDLKSKKWSQREAAVSALTALFDSAPGGRVAGEARDWFDLAAACKAALKDSHMRVVIAALQCLSSAALRVRGAFHGHAKGVLGPVSDKLRDKKASVAGAARDTLLVFAKCCLSLGELGTVLEGVSAASLEQCLHSATLVQQLASLRGVLPGETLQAADAKLLAQHAVAAIEHKDASVRSAGEQALGALMARMDGGEGAPGDEATPLRAVVTRLAESSHAHALQRARVHAGLADAQDLSIAAAAALGAGAAPAVSAAASAGGSSAPPSAAAAPKSRGGRAGSKVKSRKAGRASSAAKQPASQPAPAGGGGGSSAGAGNPGAFMGKGCAASPTDALPTPEDAATFVTALPGMDAVEGGGMASAKWQDKVAAMQAGADAVGAAAGGDVKRTLEHVLVHLHSGTNGFKALSNANLVTGIVAVVEATVAAASDAPPLTEGLLAWMLRSPLGQKIKEGRNRGGGAMQRLLLAAAFHLGPSAVAWQLLALAGAPKAIVTLKAAVTVALEQLVYAFGHAALAKDALKAVLAYAAGSDAGVGSTSKPAKTAAQDLLAAVYLSAGPKTQAWIAAAAPDMRPATATALEKQFAALPFSAAWGAARAAAPREGDLAAAVAGGTAQAAAAFEADAAAVVGLAAVHPALTAAAQAAAAGGKAAAGTAAGAGAGAAAATAGDDDAVDMASALRGAPGGLEGVLRDMGNTAGPADVTDDRKAWQIRIQAVEAVLAAAEQAAKLTTGLAVNRSLKDVLWALRERCADGAVAVKPKAAAAIAAIAAATPPGSLSPWNKGVLPAVLKLVPDKKTLIRGAALQALTAWALGGVRHPIPEPPATEEAAAAAPPHSPALDSMLPVLVPALKAATGAEVLLAWLPPLLAAAPAGELSGGCTACAPVLTKLMTARAVGTRHAAATAITAAARHSGGGPFKSALGALKDAERRTCEDAVKAAVAAGAAAAAPDAEPHTTHASGRPPTGAGGSSAGVPRSAASAAAAARQAARGLAAHGSTGSSNGTAASSGGRTGGVASLRRTGSRGRLGASGAAGAPDVDEPPLTLVLKRTAAADREARGRAARGRVWRSEDAGALRALQEDWSAAGCASGAAVQALFSDKHTAAEGALGALADAVAAQPAWLECHVDRVLRLTAVRLRSSKSTTVGAAQALLQSVLAYYAGADMGLTETDMAAIAPTVADVAGAIRDATRRSMRSLLCTLADLAVLVSSGDAANATSAPASGPLSLAGVKSLLGYTASNLSEMKNKKSVAEVLAMGSQCVTLMGGHFAARGGVGVPALSRVTGRDVYKGAAAALGGSNAEVREAALELLLSACAYYRDTTPGMDDASALGKVLRLLGGEALSGKAKDLLTQRHARAVAEHASGSDGAPGPSASDAPRSPPRAPGSRGAVPAAADTMSAGDPELAALAKSLQAALSPTGGHMSRAEMAHAAAAAAQEEAEDADDVPLSLMGEGGEGGAPRTPSARRRAKRRETGLISSNEIHKHVAAAAAAASPPPRTPTSGGGASPPGTFDTPDGGDTSGLAESMPHAEPRSRLSAGAPALRLVMDAPGAAPAGAAEADDDGASVASGASQEGDWNMLEATRLDASVAGGADAELGALRAIVAQGTPEWMLETLRELFAAQRMFTDAVAAARQERRGSAASTQSGGGVDMTVVAQELHPTVGTVDASSAAYVKGLAAVHALRSRLAEAGSSADPSAALGPWVRNAHLLLKTITTVTAAAFGGSVRPVAGALASGKAGDDVWRSVGHAEVPFALPCVTLLADWFGVPPLAEATDSACMNSLLLETTQRICDDALSKGTRAAVSKLLMRMTFRARQDVVLLALVNALARASSHQSSTAESAGAHTGQSRLPEWAIKNLCSLLNRATTHISSCKGDARPYAGLAVRDIVRSLHEYLLSHRTSLADTPQTQSPLYAVLVLLRQLVHFRVNDTLGALRSADAGGDVVPPSAVVWVYAKQFVKQLHPDVAAAEGFAGAAGAVAQAPQVAATMSNLSGGKSRTGGAQDEVGGVLVLNAVVGCYIRALQVAVTSGCAKSDEARAMGVLAACETHYPELGITLGAVEERVVPTPAKRQILKAKRMVYRTRTGGGDATAAGGASAHGGAAVDGGATFSATYDRLAARLGESAGATAPPAPVDDLPVAPPVVPDAGAASASVGRVGGTPPRAAAAPASAGVSPESIPAGGTGIPRSSASAAAVLGVPSTAQDSLARTALLRERMRSIKQRMGASKGGAKRGTAAAGDTASNKENSS